MLTARKNVRGGTLGGNDRIQKENEAEVSGLVETRTAAETGID